MRQLVSYRQLLKHRLSRTGLISGARAQLESGVLLWVITAISVSVQVVLNFRRHHVDAPQIWSGLHRFLHGMSPYGVATHRPFAYDHPPGSTLVDAPLGLFSVSAATDVILVLSGVGALLAIVALTRGRDDLPSWRPALAALIFSISRPFFEELSLANLDLIALLPIALGVLAIRCRRERLGAVLMALGVCIKPTAAAILLAPLLAKRWRVTVLALAIVATATLVGFAVVPHSWRFATSVLPFLTGPEQAQATTNGSLTGLVEYVGLGGAIPTSATQAVALLATAIIALRFRHQLALSLDSAVALLVSATMLVPRYNFEVYGVYLVLAIPFLVTVRRATEIVLGAIAVWLLVIRDVLPLEGEVVDRFRELRPGLGHLVVFALVVVMLNGRSRPYPLLAQAGDRASKPN